MDILYVYNGWKDSESLRYAMRSIAKNGRNVGRVYLVSDEKPEWCSKKVTHIPYINTRNLYKENDINEAIYTAVEKSDISDHFLIAGDDYFYINPTDFDHYPIYRKNAELPAGKDPTGRMGGWKYVQALFNSRVLTDGTTYAKDVYLPQGEDPSQWYEIDEGDVPQPDVEPQNE